MKYIQTTAVILSCLFFSFGKSFAFDEQACREAMDTLTGHRDFRGRRIEGRSVHDRQDGRAMAIDFLEEIAKKRGHRTFRQVWYAKPGGYRRNSDERSENPTKFQNLVVEIPGSLYEDEIIVVGSHYDAHPGCPGADDNGSGVVACLNLTNRQQREQSRFRLARWWDNWFGTPLDQPYRTIHLVFFDAEEPPNRLAGMGSARYLESMEKTGRLNQIRFMLNLDMLGATPSDPDYGHIVSYTRILKERLQEQLSGSLAITLDEDPERFLKMTDSGPFSRKGIPTMSIANASNGRVLRTMHTKNDDVNLIDWERYGQLNELLEKLLYRVAYTKKGLSTLVESP